MTSNALKYYSQSDFRRGIADNQESLDMRNQVLDARNVWAPLGTLVQRPGYSAIGQYSVADYTILAGQATYVDSGVIYLGASTGNASVAIMEPNATNTNAGCQFRCDYWNGNYWVPFDVLQRASVSNAVENRYCGSTALRLFFVTPSNWATTTVNSTVKYWMRYSPVGTQAPSATPTAVAGSTGLYLLNGSGFQYLPLLGQQFKYNSGTNYAFGTHFSSTSSYVFVDSQITGGDILTGFVGFNSPNPTIPAQTTVIPEFNVAYIAFNNVVYQVTNANAVATAAINTDPLIVGPIASDPTIPYPADVIPQLPAFPAANYVINFRNLIFASGIKGQSTLVRWSGAVNEGAYNVWPETSFETLSTASDNSPITALAGLGDNLVVFKQDSIWQLVFKGLDDNELPLFIPQLVVAGVGCVSQGSIQEIRGRLIFLAEDGFYAFDGTPNIRKLSDPVNTTAQRINPSHRPFATAVNWRSQYCYLCSTALDESSSNNIIFVYDYKHEAWWLWDDIPAEFMFSTSDTALQEQVIFENTSLGFFKLIGETDNFGPIDSYILTGRFGEDEILWKTAREIRIRSQNIDGSLSYYLYSDDQTLGEAAKTIIMDSPDETQADESPPDGCANVQPRRRERKAPQRELGQWYQLRVDGFKLLEGLDIGWIPESRR